ncbi:MAG: IS1595 family transposase [Proteobacteria bacterium]|nr:IS1595 family transposase [Pseudomonadota bacterium]
MEAADLTNPIFTDDEAARLHFEALRWADGVPVCFHCGVVGDAALVKRDEVKAAKRKKHARDGLYYCRSCGGQFTATMGTVYEDSHIPMRKWLLATHLMNASKKGVSALQLQRMLGIGSYRTAWFMAHRIREGMADHGSSGPLGGDGKIVEADETYYGYVEEPVEYNTKGRKFRRSKLGRGPANKRAIVALVERGGRARVFHVGTADKDMIAWIITKNVKPNTRLQTDESRLYTGADQYTGSHETVKHAAGEYARGDVNTNSVEGFFGVFKKGMTGVYQHCGEKYLARYVAEFEFRHNNRVKLGVDDKERAARAVKGTVGKRLTLRIPKGHPASA